MPVARRTPLVNRRFGGPAVVVLGAIGALAFVVVGSRGGRWPSTVSGKPASTLARAAPSAGVRPGLVDGAVIYPLGRWHLAPFETLHHVVLWVSHIVILHKRSLLPGGILRPPPWVPEAAPARSSQDAGRLAVEVLDELRSGSLTFDEAARRYSEDVTTRDWGGSLGGVRASQLPSQFLDAIETLEPGQTSAVFATDMGFHILWWREPPAAAVVAGKRILIPYDTSVWPRNIEVRRSRAEAKALAERAAKEAADGRPFEDLVTAYSEGPESESGGDFGAWSTRDPGLEPRVVEVLAGLAVGEASRPFETSRGFQNREAHRRRSPRALRGSSGARSLQREAAARGGLLPR